MSSTYRLICMSHDPALVIYDNEWNNPGLAADAAVERFVSPADRHQHCRLMIGRWSGGLFEVGCVRNSKHPGVYHPTTDEWVDLAWLRLIVISGAEAVEQAKLPTCWTYEVAARLHAAGLL